MAYNVDIDMNDFQLMILIFYNKVYYLKNKFISYFGNVIQIFAVMLSFGVVLLPDAL